MGDLPLPALARPGGLRSAQNAVEHPPLTSSLEPSDASAVLDVLRQAVEDNSLAKGTVFTAIANTARVMSGADGTAMASRQDGAIVCQARSGEMAPPLGAPLNSETGISGECIRTAATLVCDDAWSDDRVDFEVCYNLGIRSIAVVPLRGPTGVFGILEAFSSRASAFEKDKIDSLLALAEIAELAYERETAPPVQSPAVKRSLKFVPASVNYKAAIKNVLETSKRHWYVGPALVALLLIGIIIRMSWRQTGAEIAASTTASHSQPSPTAPAPEAATLPSSKPDSAVSVKRVERGQSKSPLKNAADLERDTDNAQPASSINLLPSRSESKSADVPNNSTGAADSDSPPTVEFSSSQTPSQLTQLGVSSEALPQFGAAVSQGFVAPVLIQKVTPSYPQQARGQRVSGTVVLDATISPDGSVRKATVVSGFPILAASALSAVREWRYKPAMLNGKKVETQERVTVVFNLP